MAAAVESQAPTAALQEKEPLATDIALLKIDDAPTEDPDNTTGVRETPFLRPVPETKIPVRPELSTEETTKYNSVHNAVSSWTAVPTSSGPNPGHTAITEEEQMWLSRECLLRYLRATKWNVQQAISRLQATLIWRREFGIANDGKIKKDYVSIESETGKQWILGYDNEGRPCQYLNPSRQNTERSERQIEHLVFMMERSIDLMPPGQETLALLINFAETSKGQGASVAQGRQTLNILQNHYPERLGRAFCANLPWHIWAFMKIITPFIDPVTRQKIIFDSPLSNHVPPSQLRKSHGGELDFEYDHSKYWPALTDLAESRKKNMYERWVKAGSRIGEFENYLRGGQETCLKDTMPRGSDEMSEKSRRNLSPDRPTKTVSISEEKAKIPSPKGSLRGSPKTSVDKTSNEKSAKLESTKESTTEPIQRVESPGEIETAPPVPAK